MRLSCGNAYSPVLGSKGRRFKFGRPDQKTQVREVPGFRSGASFDLREPLREPPALADPGVSRRSCPWPPRPWSAQAGSRTGTFEIDVDSKRKHAALAVPILIAVWGVAPGSGKSTAKSGHVL
jgi:hypothetical protein